MSQLPNYENNAGFVKTAITFGEAAPQQPMLEPEPAAPGIDPTAAAMEAFAGVSAAAADAVGRAKSKEQQLKAREEERKRLEAERKARETKAAGERQERFEVKQQSEQMLIDMQAYLIKNPDANIAQLVDQFAPRIPGSPLTAGPIAALNHAEIAGLYAETNAVKYGRQLVENINSRMTDPNFSNVAYDEKSGSPWALEASEEQFALFMQKQIEELGIPEQLMQDSRFAVQWDGQMQKVLGDAKENWDTAARGAMQTATLAEVESTVSVLLDTLELGDAHEEITKLMANPGLRNVWGNSGTVNAVGHTLLNAALAADPKAWTALNSAVTASGTAVINAKAYPELYREYTEKKPVIEDRLAKAAKERWKEGIISFNETAIDQANTLVLGFFEANEDITHGEIHTALQAIGNLGVPIEYDEVSDEVSLTLPDADSGFKNVSLDLTKLKTRSVNTRIENAVAEYMGEKGNNEGDALPEPNAWAKAAAKFAHNTPHPGMKKRFSRWATLLESYDGEELTDAQVAGVAEALTYYRAFTAEGDGPLAGKYLDRDGLILFEIFSTLEKGTDDELSIAGVDRPLGLSPAGDIAGAMRALSDFRFNEAQPGRSPDTASQKEAELILTTLPPVLKQDILNIANIVYAATPVGGLEYLDLVQNLQDQLIQQDSETHILAGNILKIPAFSSRHAVETVVTDLRRELLDGDGLALTNPVLQELTAYLKEHTDTDEQFGVVVQGLKIVTPAHGNDNSVVFESATGNRIGPPVYFGSADGELESLLRELAISTSNYNEANASVSSTVTEGGAELLRETLEVPGALVEKTGEAVKKAIPQIPFAQETIDWVDGVAGAVGQGMVEGGWVPWMAESRYNFIYGWEELKWSTGAPPQMHWKKYRKERLQKEGKWEEYLNTWPHLRDENNKEEDASAE